MLSLLCLAAMALPSPYGIEPRYFPAQDESSLERQIYNDLRSVSNLLRVNIHNRTPGDSVLSIQAVEDEQFTIILDTQATGYDDSGRVSERVVWLLFRTRVYLDVSDSEAQELVNNLNRGQWVGTYYIDTDGELMFRWSHNICSDDGMALSELVDGIVRGLQVTKNGWRAATQLRLQLSSMEEAAPGPLFLPADEEAGRARDKAWC